MAKASTAKKALTAIVPKLTKAATGTPVVTQKPPNIEWVKHPKWTWSLVTYLTDHPIFRAKLFSDSTADAYATLAQHIFEHDPLQADGYKVKPARYLTSVETRLRRLKEEYKKHLQTLGATGAGLAPEDVTPDSEMANLVASIVSEWPWWKEFHSFWRELPNHNPIAVTTSTPGVDHAGQAAAMFKFAGHDDVEETPTAADGIVGEEHGGDSENDGEEDGVEGKELDELSVSSSPPLPVSLVFATSKPAQVNMSTRALVIKPAGRDAGLLKGQVNRSKGLAAATSSQTTSGKTINQKTAVEKFNNYRSMESARLEERRKHEYDLKMAQVSNKRLKYEFKLKIAETERHNADAERQARLKELELQIQLAQLANPNVRVAQVPSIQTTIYSNPVLTPVQPRLPLSAYNTPTPIPSTTVNTPDFSSAKSSVTPFEIQASFSSPSFGSFGAEAEGTSMLEGLSSDDWMKSGSNIFTNENNFDDIYASPSSSALVFHGQPQPPSHHQCCTKERQTQPAQALGRKEDLLVHVQCKILVYG
ncbi:hypothetical protein BYT27DRAFT_7248442 [Phlegmacium glaucopus]|nr:hypothetical protein BYT27DRAFT_7248442 [Phlegmacium glaucopus]